MHPRRLASFAFVLVILVTGCRATAAIPVGENPQVTLDAVTEVNGGACAAGGLPGVVAQPTSLGGVEACHLFGTFDLAQSGLPIDIIRADDRILVTTEFEFTRTFLLESQGVLTGALAAPGDEWTISVTFPGEVLEQAGGTTSGRTVTWVFDQAHRFSVPPMAVGLSRPGVPWDALLPAWAFLGGVALVSAVEAARGRVTDR